MLSGLGPRADRSLIPVRPKNYRSIALYAISLAESPVVLVDRQLTTDCSELGPLTQRKIRGLRNFEIRDGSVPMLGVHGHPDEMWFSENYARAAEHCAAQGWLKLCACCATRLQNERSATLDTPVPTARRGIASERATAFESPSQG